MTQDHNKKTLRQFQCRDYLWEIFEQMGAELECSTDYLINEAMRQYARSRNWGNRSAARPAAAPSSAPSYGQRPAAPLPAPVASGSSGRMSVPVATPPPMASQRKTAPSGAMMARPGPTTGSFPPPLPGGQPASGARGGGGMPSLYVIFNGQKVPVNKEEFVIGRGSKTADLPIKDGNISRRHAAVVLQSGAFYMKDLGSTNGIEFNGQRVDTRRIEEGDIYQICDYELRFTYQ